MAPQIVVFEFIRVFAELTRDPLFVATKVRELAEHGILCELPYVAQRGVEMWVKHGAQPGELKDFIVLAVTLSLRAELATCDRKLRKLAEEYGVRKRP